MKTDPALGKEIDHTREMKDGQCTLCKKSYKNLTLHQSKAHKKDMWKFVVNKKNLQMDVYNFGRSIGGEEGHFEPEISDMKDGSIMYSYVIAVESANTIKNVNSIYFTLYGYEEGEDNYKISMDKDADVSYEIINKRDEHTIRPVDKNNYTIEFV